MSSMMGRLCCRCHEFCRLRITWITSLIGLYLIFQKRSRQLSKVPGSSKAAQQFALSCAACQLPDGLDLGAFAKNIFMIMLQDFMDPWTFNQKNLMKCCKEILLPDGKQIPFCAYNNVGYREQARVQLQARERQRNQARRAGVPYTPEPLTFSFTQK